MFSLKHLFIFPLRSLNIIAILKSSSWVSAKLLFLGPITISLLASRRSILSWLFMFVFLFGIWASGVMMFVVFLGEDI